MQLFYSSLIKEDVIVLEAEEARHCSQVLRKREGDVIQVIDGKGNFYEGALFSIAKKECLVKITKLEANFNPRPFHLHIAIAPTKNINRLEWFLEKATEIGIDEITPILCQNSERQKIRIDRLNRILVAAMKQSLKAHLPQLNELQDCNDFLTNHSTAETQCFIAHCREGDKIQLKKHLNQGQNVCIMIGPEGDFSEEEVQHARKQGFSGLSLGSSRLRTETAGIVACHIANFLNEV